MLLSLTPNQLRALGPGPATLLADLLARAAPGQPVEATCPNQGRRGYGGDLRALAQAGILQVEDPGSWTRASYTVRLLAAEDGNWCREVGALDRWPRLYPEIWDQLRADRPDLADTDFRRRFQHGVLSALCATERPVGATSILRWMASALNIAAPDALPDPRAAQTAAAQDTPVPRAAQKALLGDPEYARLANFRDPGETPRGN